MRRERKEQLTEHQLMMRPEHDPKAHEVWDRYRAIEARGGRPVAWRTAGGSYFVRDDLETS
jgi:hypothetical protein